jgi:CheY-like chemotaxis protein
MMGGKLAVTSTEGEGSTFYFTATLGACSEQKLIPGITPDITLWEGLRVLIVDDNETNRKILLEICTGWGMHPQAVEDARVAWQALLDAARRGEPFQLVLTDACMPVEDGFSLAERIQQAPEIGAPLVMMLSSVDRQQDVDRCQSLGIRSFLTKPVRQSELFNAIGAVLSGSTQPLAQESAIPRAGCPPLRILLAEDSLPNQKLARGLLERWHHQVTVVNDGQEAVELAQRENFDVILMDVQMPRLDGLQATAEIRSWEQERGQHIPIIAMTAHAQQSDRERCLHAGMDDYISKPIRSHLLNEVLSRNAPPQTNWTPPQRVQLQAATSSSLIEPHRDEAVLECREQLESTNGAVPESSPAIDWQSLLQMTAGDHDLAREVASAFLFEGPQLDTHLDSALNHRDAAVLRRAAHTLKSNLRTLGSPAHAIAGELEQAAIREDWETCLKQVPALRLQVQQVLRAVQQQLAAG